MAGRRFGRVTVLATGLALLMLVVVAAGPAAARPAKKPQRATLKMQTVPRLEGARVVLDGTVFLTDARGFVRIATVAGRHRLQVLPPLSLPAGTTVRFAGWLGHYSRGPRAIMLSPGTRLASAGFVTSRAVTVRVIDQEGRRVPRSAITRIRLADSLGRRFSLTSGRAVLLAADRIVRNPAGLVSVPIRYSIQQVVMRDVNVVHRGGQSFYVGDSQTWTVRTLLFPLRIEVRDALFGFSLGHSVRLARRGGAARVVELGPGHAVTVARLTRGAYDLTPNGPGFGLSSTTSLSRPQTATLLLLSWVDIASVGAVAALFLIGLPVVGGRIARRSGTHMPAWRARPVDGATSRTARPVLLKDVTRQSRKP